MLEDLAMMQEQPELYGLTKHRNFSIEREFRDGHTGYRAAGWNTDRVDDSTAQPSAVSVGYADPHRHL